MTMGWHMVRSFRHRWLAPLFAGSRPGNSQLLGSALALACPGRPKKYATRFTFPSSSATRRIGQRLLVGGGIKPEDRAALADLLGDEILERRHLEGFVGDLIGKMRGDHHHAVAVAQDDVAGKHRRIAAADRHVDFDRLVQREVGRRARPVVKGGKAEFGDLGANRESRRR